MENKDLKQTLDKLKLELEKIEKTDLESIRRLKGLIDSVQTKLKEPKNKKHHNRLSPQLNEAVVHFENTHPFISEILEELVAILVKIGL